MNSFQSIAESKNTSLAVVAPGIAEALFATALGLAAAVTALLSYLFTFSLNQQLFAFSCSAIIITPLLVFLFHTHMIYILL